MYGSYTNSSVYMWWLECLYTQLYACLLGVHDCLAKCWCLRAELLQIINKGLMTWPLAALWVNHAWKSPAKSGTSSAQLRFIPPPPINFSQPLATIYLTPPWLASLSAAVLQTPLHWCINRPQSLSAQRLVRMCQMEFNLKLKLWWYTYQSKRPLLTN